PRGPVGGRGPGRLARSGLVPVPGESETVPKTPAAGGPPRARQVPSRTRENRGIIPAADAGTAAPRRAAAAAPAGLVCPRRPTAPPSGRGLHPRRSAGGRTDRPPESKGRRPWGRDSRSVLQFLLEPFNGPHPEHARGVGTASQVLPNLLEREPF